MEKFIYIFPESHPFKNNYQVVYAKNLNGANKRMYERFGTYANYIPKEHVDDFEKFTTKGKLNPIYCEGVN